MLLAKLIHVNDRAGDGRQGNEIQDLAKPLLQPSRRRHTQRVGVQPHFNQQLAAITGRPARNFRPQTGPGPGAQTLVNEYRQVSVTKFSRKLGGNSQTCSGL